MRWLALSVMMFGTHAGAANLNAASYTWQIFSERCLDRLIAGRPADTGEFDAFPENSDPVHVNGLFQTALPNITFQYDVISGMKMCQVNYYSNNVAALVDELEENMKSAFSHDILSTLDECRELGKIKRLSRYLIPPSLTKDDSILAVLVAEMTFEEFDRAVFTVAEAPAPLPEKMECDD